MRLDVSDRRSSDRPFRTRRRAAIAIGAALVAVLVPASSAFADDPPASVSTDVAAAVSDAGGAPAVEQPVAGVDLPDTAADGIGVGDLTMGLPANGAGVDTPNGTVFDGAAADTAVVTQATDDGARALVYIADADAPERYRFPIEGAGSLVLTADGGVAVINADPSKPDGQIAPPWAQDANGTPVPTHYEIDGTTLIQVVEHRSGDYAYGITADPHWGWAHIHRVWSHSQAISAYRTARGATKANALAAALVGALTEGIGIVVVGALQSFGFDTVADMINDANEDSHGRGVIFDIGFRCREVPFLPDPCFPAVWANPR
jgi:hypothetical protein